jgi:hypothetical protein
MKTVAVFLATFMCGFVIYLSQLPSKQIYDCRYVSYPMAVDVPKEVIHECHKRKLT